MKKSDDKLVYSMLYSDSNSKIHSLTDNELEAVDFIPERCPNSEINSITIDTNLSTKNCSAKKPGRINTTKIECAIRG